MPGVHGRIEQVVHLLGGLVAVHQYFLDDHLLGDRRFGEGLFDGMQGMGRLFQGAARASAPM